MHPNRQLEEIVARAAAIVAFYDQGDGRWKDRQGMAVELRTVIHGLDADRKNVDALRPQFFDALKVEFIARYGNVIGGRLAEMARDDA